jgi:hypothetical protein
MPTNDSSRPASEYTDDTSTVRVRVREPLVGNYDLLLRPANDVLDDVERFIIAHLSPREPARPPDQDRSSST